MRKLVLFVCLLLIVCGFGATVDGIVEPNGGLAAILQVDTTTEYAIGDDVKIWALIYDDGVSFDPYEMTLRVGWPGRDVPMIRRDTGTYDATVTILESDVAERTTLHVIVWVYADSLHTSWVTDSVEVPVKHLKLEVSVDETADEVPAPGEMVNFTVRSTYEGALVDPDAGTLDVQRYLVGSSIGIPVTMTRVGTGLHRGTLTLPTVKSSNTFNLVARGEYTSPAGMVHGSGSTSFELYTLPVWMNTLSVTNTGAVVEVHVHELDGVPYPISIEGYPLQGAQVTMDYEYRSDQYVTEQESTDGITDVNGVAVLTLSWPDLYKYDLTVAIEGTVMAPNFYRQDFEDRIIVRDKVDLADEDFFEVELVSEHPIPVTTPLIDMRFHARNNGNALANHDIMAYIYDENAVYFRKTVTTDARGYMDISIKPPVQNDPGRVYASPWFYFNADLGGFRRTDGAGYYIGDMSLRGHIDPLVDVDASIKVSTPKENNEVTVVLDHPDADGREERAIIGWGIGDPGELKLNWLLHRQGTCFPLHQYLGYTTSKFKYVNYEPCYWSDGAYHASFHYPGFLPDHQDVFVYGVITYRKDAGDEAVAAFVQDLTPVAGKGWPTVALTSPAPAGWYEGEVNITGTAHDADGSVESVEVRVDRGEWMTATGTEDWYYLLDTSGLHYGTHYIDLRAYNGEKHSKVFPFAINTDQKPSVEVVNPVDGGHYLGVLEINGTAYDDNPLEGVKLRVDGGTWEVVTGTTEWNHTLDLSGMASGDHTLEVIAYTGPAESFAAKLVFVVDLPPVVGMTDPPDGAEVAGIFHVKGVATDDFGLDAVEIRIDGGDWIAVTDELVWSYELDTRTLGFGTHKVEARAFDGISYSTIEGATFHVDNPPTVSDVNLVDGQYVSGVFRVEGHSGDDDGVEAVEVSVDGGDWEDAEGTEDWYYDLDTTGLERGEHTLRVRSYDGQTYSEEEVVTFNVDEPPQVGDIDLEVGETVHGTVTITGNATDDGTVEKVQVRIDGGDWIDVDGGESWMYDLDTTGLAHGTHTLEVRVWDGYQWSDPVSVEFDVDQLPGVAIASPEEGAVLKKDFEVSGTASDDAQVMRVEFRVDGGEWETAAGTDAWSQAMKLKDLKKGEHTLEVRAYDGTQYSESASVTFKVKKEEKGSPGFGACAALMGLVALGLAMASRRRP